ncbi:MAG: DUF4190 domain-containing protein [Oscillospiraceae bacterium]|nr:DUF4190 domain-containing protein [Oscillospiraceae bacterium]
MNVKGMSIAAMVCGIIGVVFSFIPVVCFVAFPCAIAGIVLAAVAMNRINAGAEGSKGMAIAGLVCGIIGCAFGIPSLICNICACQTANAVNKGLNGLFQ